LDAAAPDAPGKTTSFKTLTLNYESIFLVLKPISHQIDLISAQKGRYAASTYQMNKKVQNILNSMRAILTLFRAMNFSMLLVLVASDVFCIL